MTNAATKLSVIQDIRPTLGCDPEFFFRNNGSVIGSEKVFNKEGLPAGNGSRFIIDGVQAELNPRPNTCREVLASEIRMCFLSLKQELDSKHKDITCDFSRSIEISKEKLDELSEDSKKFGCAPSTSAYKSKAKLDIRNVNADKYRIRAAGGHIHFGNEHGYLFMKHVEKTVHMLDIICANTCVLIDRDPANIERRKFYGRAGEFRLPKHGLEYRTLSNFWLTHGALMSFAFGMARNAIAIMSMKNAEQYYDAFNDLVKISNVSKAINNNDSDLAMKNFKAIEPLLLEINPELPGFPIHKRNIDSFHHFIDRIDTDGLEYWFKEDPFAYWTGPQGAYGYSSFIGSTIAPDLANKTKKAKAA